MDASANGAKAMRMGEAIAAWRYKHRYSVRAVAKVIGISSATLNRVERGEPCDGKTLAKIMVWLLSE